MSSSRRTTFVCFGEALWDVLPRGIFLGGAPLNVAYHLSRNNHAAVPVSTVGSDFLGDEIIRRVNAWGLETRAICRDRRRPTGTVRASLDAHGAATYSITRSVAWDAIDSRAALALVRSPAAVIYGSLALREKANRHALERLFAAWPGALRVLDINLRQPFDQGTNVEFALSHAQLLKLNHEELQRLSGLPVARLPQIERAVRRLAARRSLSRICVTGGPRGAGLLWDGEWTWAPGRKVNVRDTIGAGDAFLGALLSAVVGHRAPPPVALARACRLGEFVAERDGATPPYRCDSSGKPRPID